MKNKKKYPDGGKVNNVKQPIPDFGFNFKPQPAISDNIGRGVELFDPLSQQRTNDEVGKQALLRIQQKQLSNQSSISKSTKNTTQQENQRISKIRQYATSQGNSIDDQGNITTSPLNKIAENPTFNRFANNIAFPMMDAAMVVDGAGIVRQGVSSLLKTGIKELPKASQEILSTSSGMDALPEGYNSHLFKKQGYVPPTNDPNLKSFLTDNKDGNVFKQPYKGKYPEFQNEIDLFIQNHNRELNLKPTNFPQANNVKNNLLNRIETPEGQKRLNNLGVNQENLNNLRIVQDNSTYGYYSPGNYTNIKTIGLHPDLPNDAVNNITRHELEHAIQAKNPTEIDKMLGDLELRKEAKPLENNGYKKLDGTVNGQDVKNMLSSRQDATDYFANGSEGREKSAFLAELQQHLVDNNFIKHPYDNITPEIIKDAHFESIGNNSYPLRILNIMKSTDANYNLLSKGLNKMLLPTGVIAGGAALSQKQYKNGGKINNSDWEILSDGDWEILN